MELLRKEMERVGLNNNSSNSNSNSNSKEHQTREGKKQEIIMNGSDDNNNKKNGNNKEQQKTMLRTPADIFDHPSFYSFVLDMPGLDAQNIKGGLHVTGKKKKQQMGEGVKVLRVERRRARYMRKFTLPADASHEDVKATYKDGVLSITVSKIPPQLQHVEQSNSTSPTTTLTTTTTDNDVSSS
ncbi:hypothetical protein Cgig2_025865 [Carnegiea gigantea]|uniref:SHSP domain-containing protein n=1 Tax=Carnegiea gigantea TaxID=171969 RepID=A0A9Q1Q668_9CARY|nr:hypothetical protein Cgig2_025865 [Carnegiea gigantea]